MRSLPHVTVASLLERDGKFLLVEETIGRGNVLNQPAGHLEQNETLVDAVVRETLEETGWLMRPTQLTGIYRWSNSKTNVTYVRFCFTGELLNHDASRPLDKGIIAAHWFDLNQIKTHHLPLRSPLVMRCIEDYLAGQRFNLDLITEVT